ncbi:MAG: hypothetical protein R3229_13170 [Alphaproteobacteria bacterium]|nr:hypothetical protein [Alphaproteobacteria bacterium]
MWGIKFKKQADCDTVRAGSVYRIVRRDNLVETATVLAVGDDSCGIPHVRYQVRIGRADNKVFEEGPRVLALSCFAEHYHEPLAS